MAVERRPGSRPLLSVVYPTILFILLTIAVFQLRTARNALNPEIEVGIRSTGDGGALRHLLQDPKTDDNPSNDENEQPPPTKPPRPPKKPKDPPADDKPTSITTTTDASITSTKGGISVSTTSEATTAATTEASGPRRRLIHKPIVWEGNDTCVPPAYHEFPPDLFSQHSRQNGAVVIHILVGLYMFYALAVVCDSYFVSALEKICEKLGLTEDVAGATFMAAGGSAPELFASLLGVFVAKGDVGTGTIVGSAVFNILFVIGACGLLSGGIVELTWWPLLRDSSFYAVTVVILIGVMADGAVSWWETLIMLLFYLVYILIMNFNIQLKSWLISNTALSRMEDMEASSRGILDNNITGKAYSSYVQFNNEVNEYSESSAYQPTAVVPARVPADVSIHEYYWPHRRQTFFEFIFRLMYLPQFRPKTRFKYATRRIILEIVRVRQEGLPAIASGGYDGGYDFPENDISKQHGRPNEPSSETDDEWKRVPRMADEGIFKVIQWGLTVPVQAALYYTIPNCHKDRWERWFLLTFLGSMLWIAIFSYVLVWMVTLIGYTCGVPDTIMGITFLAAGTSVPDAISSLMVARQGQGDMAVSNSIGSNVFDILIGLALPWFIQTVIVLPGSQVYINSRGMVINVVLLFISIVATIATVHMNHWQLNQRLGIILLLFYVVFLIFSILIEFNMFGFVNPPECEE